MISVIIFGTGALSQAVHGFIDKDKVNIKYYCDNNTEKWNTNYRGKLVIPPQRLLEENYEYIVIASQYSKEICRQLMDMGIESKKIFEYNLFFDNLNSKYPRDRIEDFLNNNNKYECIITGISYAYAGIDVNDLKLKSYTFANGSQDLYYDYRIAKYVIENYNKSKLKYCIIGLSYYSFEYDLSLSSMSHKLYGYYDFFKDLHNSKDKSIIERYHENREIGTKIMKIENTDLKFEGKYDWYVKQSEEYQDKIAKSIALKDSNKDYPLTVRENIQIFTKYINMLDTNNVKPIVIIFPTTKYYRKYFDVKLINKFNMIIEDLRKNMNFEVYDYFSSDLFFGEDFWDTSHLSIYGAKKMSQILNKLL